MPRNSLQCALWKARLGCLVRGLNASNLWQSGRADTHICASEYQGGTRVGCTRDKIALSTVFMPALRSRTSSKPITRCLILSAICDKILQTEAAFSFRTATQRHRLGQPCAVSRILGFARRNHICQKQHTFNTMSCILLLGSLCSGAANRLSYRFLPSVCWRTKPYGK